MSDFDEAALRAEVGAWLRANFRPDLGLVEWRSRLADSGWGAPHWPRQWYGRGLPVGAVRVINEAFVAAGAVGVASTGIRVLAAATLLEHGNDGHKQRYLRRVLTGEDIWCQLFSEPGSGSDLAGATTRAEFDGSRYRINGQKVWTTSAHRARFGLLLARTDFAAPKHRGLSFFVIDMHQPGVEVRPLKQMNGHASFNQVFLTDAVVEADALVGTLGGGWQVAMTTLAHERRKAASVAGVPGSAGSGRIFDELREEESIANEPYRWYPQRAGRVDLVVGRARQTGTWEDPLVREQIARLLILSRTAAWTAARARAAQQLGRPQGPEGSLGKLAASQVARLAAHVHTLTSGADAALAGSDSPLDGTIAEILLSVPATSIAGGTDEIQRNIISERVLGMPKEARVDDGPFSQRARSPG
jgi:alkylation response protein AidB-like acyl-CoA dehydrogenase